MLRSVPSHISGAGWVEMGWPPVRETCVGIETSKGVDCSEREQGAYTMISTLCDYNLFIVIVIVIFIVMTYTFIEAYLLSRTLNAFGSIVFIGLSDKILTIKHKNQQQQQIKWAMETWKGHCSFTSTVYRTYLHIITRKKTLLSKQCLFGLLFRVNNLSRPQKQLSHRIMRRPSE